MPNNKKLSITLLIVLFASIAFNVFAGSTPAIPPEYAHLAEMPKVQFEEIPKDERIIQEETEYIYVVEYDGYTYIVAKF